jgi:hypothetical protein
VAQAKLREVAFFDVYTPNDARGFNGTWANYPFFASGTVVVNTIEQTGGLFVLRPRRANLRLAVAPLSPTDFRLTVTNDGPAGVEGAELFLSGGTLMALTPSQGTCARRQGVCGLGALASGASATVNVQLSPVGKNPNVRASVEATGAIDDQAGDDSVEFAPDMPWW